MAKVWPKKNMFDFNYTSYKTGNISWGEGYFQKASTFLTPNLLSQLCNL